MIMNISYLELQNLHDNLASIWSVASKKIILSKGHNLLVNNKNKLAYPYMSPWDVEKVKNNNLIISQLNSKICKLLFAMSS